jgi:hypothetical protein
MPLTNLHTNWSLDPNALTYQGERNFLLKVAENDTLRTTFSPLAAHFDGNNSIAIGYGFDLLSKSIA